MNAIDISNPGFLAVSALVVAGAIKSLCGIYAKRKAAEFIAIIHDMKDDTKFNQTDKVWMRGFVGDKVDHPFRLAALLMPILAVGAIVFAIKETWPLRKMRANEAEQYMEREIEEASVEIVRISENVDPREGNLWLDPRRRRASVIGDQIAFLMSPFLTIWMILWLIPALLVAGLILPASLVSPSQWHVISQAVKGWVERFRITISHGLRFT